ncbi:nuclear transport factor 2 family protein [Algoriphagus halophilus]|uniref:nuclear transport factor 2 family protein n=1 Tax=Algoriphagus halophilus TaxID=226505 RepID=UPI00358EF08E
MGSEKGQLLEKNYDRIVNVGYCLTPYENLRDIIHPDAVVFGTAKDEQLFTFEQIDELFKAQYIQMSQLDSKIERKRITTHFSLDGNHAIIIELVNMNMASEDVTINLELRTSCSMEFISGTWVLTHWHASTAANTENDPWHLEEWRRERETLQNLVDQQTKELLLKNRELEIETALERIRAKTMAMEKSEELAPTASLLFQQLKNLGINTYSSGFTIWDEKQNQLISWMCNADGSMNPPFIMPIAENEWHQSQFESWKKGEHFLVKDLSGDELQAYFKYLQSFPMLSQAFQKSIKAGFPMPKRQIHHVANFTSGNLLLITLEPLPEAHGLFQRFAKVFEQTYTRFLDLQKAEEQAKEARIEAALERVRSRTMGMQKAEELGEVATVLFSELNALVDNLWTCGFVLCEKNRQEDEWWLSLDNGLIQPFRLPNVGDFAHEKLYEGWEKGKLIELLP